MWGLAFRVWGALEGLKARRSLEIGLQVPQLKL